MKKTILKNAAFGAFLLLSVGVICSCSASKKTISSQIEEEYYEDFEDVEYIDIETGATRIIK